MNVCGSFTPSEFAAALKHLKPGKAPGPDSICPELLLHAEAALKSWLCSFLSSCLHHLKITKIWRRALVVAIPKPMKPVEDPKSYRPISLLCPLQDPREARLHPYRAHCRPASSSGASWVPTGEVQSRPNCSTYPTHRGLI